MKKKKKKVILVLRPLHVSGSISQCQGPSTSINCKCPKMEVGGKMWVLKLQKCCPKLSDTSVLENSCVLSKALLSIDHAPQGSFIGMGCFSKNVMGCCPSRVPKSVPWTCILASGVNSAAILQ